MPNTTGEIENGRSISVTTPNTRLSGTAITATSSGIALRRVRYGIAARIP